MARDWLADSPREQRPRSNPWTIIGWMILGALYLAMLGVVGCTAYLMASA